jgi:hypothetical protein
VFTAAAWPAAPRAARGVPQGAPPPSAVGALRPHALRATLAPEVAPEGRRAALDALPLDAALGALRPGGPGFTTLDVRPAFPEAARVALFAAARAACGSEPTAKTFPLIRKGEPTVDAALPAALRREAAVIVEWVWAGLRARFPDEPVVPALAELRVVDADAGHTNHYAWHHDGHWFTATLALVGPSTTIDDDGHVFTPRSGSLVLFSGLQRAAAVPEVRPTWHNAPPGFDRGPVDVDRLALMIFFRADPSRGGGDAGEFAGG